MLEENLGDEFESAKEGTENVADHNARVARIQAALDYVGRERKEVTCLVNFGTEFISRKDVNETESKEAIVSLKSKIAFLQF